MACLPNANKCEWNDLKHFISHFNQENSSNFQRTYCLDRCNSTSPQPEILCTDTRTDITMVVERKTLLWPIDYAQQHAGIHKLIENIILELERLNLHLELLKISLPNNINTTNDRIIETYAKSIANFIFVNMPLFPSQNYSSPRPIPFSIRKQEVFERDDDEPQVDAMFTTSDIVPEDLQDARNTPISWDQRVNGYLTNTSTKFSTYLNAKHRILIFDIVSASLFSLLDSESWWGGFLPKLIIPNDISEIWISFNYDGDSWRFTKIYPLAN